MRVRVGDPSIDWLALPPQSDRKSVAIVEGTRSRLVGITSETIAAVEVDGQPALQRTQTLESDELGNREAKTVVLRNGFVPCTHREVAEDRTLSIAYRSHSVVGEIRMSRGRAIPIQAEFESPVFDAHSVEMLLRLLPLTADCAAEVPVFHAGRGSQILVRVQVVGSEIISVCHQLHRAWRIRTDWDSVRQDYWIGAKEKHLLRQVSPLSENTRLVFAR